MDERRGALEYDFRCRFQFPLEDVGVEMGWGEALRLIKILRADPSSMLACSVEGWEYPLPREVAVLMDLYDLQYAKTGAKNRKPYPRPFKTDNKSRERIGDTKGRSREEVMAILAQWAPGATPPI